MHWISPADEKTHEDYLQVLAAGDFDSVLEAIGKALRLHGLVAYHLTFIGVSHSVEGFVHHDSTATGGGVYNLIIPLLLEENVPPELILVDDTHEERRGGYKYRVGVGAMMGDDAMHGTMECDYREMEDAKWGGEWQSDDTVNRKKSGMRMAATVYIADVHSRNVQSIADNTLTQIFPLPEPLNIGVKERTDWWETRDASHFDFMINSKIAKNVPKTGCAKAIRK